MRGYGKLYFLAFLLSAVFKNREAHTHSMAPGIIKDLYLFNSLDSKGLEQQGTGAFWILSMIVDMLTQDFPPTPGGISSHVDELSKHLAMEGIKIRLFIPCFSREKEGRESDPFGRELYRVYRGAPISSNLSVIRIVKTLSYIPNTIDEWKRVNKKEPSDIIHVHNTFYEPIIIKGFKRPKVITEHSSAFLIYTEKPLLKRVISGQFRQMHHIICPSRELAERCRDIGYKGVISFISNGVDADYFRPDIAPQKPHICEIKERFKNKRIILCPRRLEAKNGVIYLLNALLFMKRSDFHILIAGQGAMMEEYKEFVQKNNLSDKVTLLGNVPKCEMREYIAISSLCVFPSLYEATSIACLECMASGRPVVATNVGGLPYLVENGTNGILVPPKDAEAIATALSHLLDNQDIRKGMGESARNIVLSRFCWKNLAESTARIYSEVIKDYKGAIYGS